MAKVSKKILKSIVKECLVEILAEGLTGGDAVSLNESINTHSNKNLSRMLPPKKKVKNQNFEKKVNNVIQNATNDPVMASILADTAKTTLQEQNQNDSPGKFITGHKDNAARVASEADPTEMFGEAASNWAQLAFSNK
jgi:hypothetical protein